MNSAVFSEYVQTQIDNNDRPIDFFPEGTRSRTVQNLVSAFIILSTT